MEVEQLLALQAEYAAAIALNTLPAAMPLTIALLANVVDGANPSPNAVAVRPGQVRLLGDA